MIPKIKPEDLILFQTFAHPIASAEVLFHDFDTLGVWDKEQFGKIRMYQYPMLAWDSLLLEDSKKSKEENYELKASLAESYNVGGRLTGKSRISIILDSVNAIIKKLFKWAVISSYDKLHVQEIFEALISAFENHKILKLLRGKSLRSPTYKMTFANGILLESVNMNLTGKNPGCFDDKTEILTQRGWKYFEKVTLNDKVLTYDIKKGVSYYKRPKKIIKSFYNGIMLKFNNADSEFVVTPNHKFIMIENNKAVIKTLQDNIYKQFYLPCRAKFRGNNKNSLSLSGIVNGKFSKLTIDMKIWVAFLAWYLSEGSLSRDKHYRIQIFQKNHCIDLENILKKLPIQFYKKPDVKYNGFRYILSNKLIHQHLEKYFGRAKTKRVANYIKNLNHNLLKIFIQNYLLGDGCITYKKNKYKNETVFSSVKELADDLQEIAQKAGYKTNLRIRKSKYNNKPYFMYIVTLCLTQNRVFKKEKILPITYKGKVYCVDVPSHHTILVRRNGSVIWSQNSQFFGKHVDRHFMEECSFINKDISAKLLMSQAEEGCIKRYSGMTNFTKTSPMGEIFFDLKNKSKITNLPSYVNPTWNDKKEADAIKEFGGSDSPGYAVQIEGKVIEGMDSVFDIQRVRQTYLLDKEGEGIPITVFEVNKDNFHRYREIIVIEKPANADSLGIYFDVGEGGAPSEYIIVSKTDKMYRYIYRITTFQLSPNEEEEFVDYLIAVFSPNVLALDHTSGIGKSLFSHLINKYPDNRSSFIPVDFNSNIEIGFKKDASGRFIMDKSGKHVLETANTVDWSIQCLKDIFYNQKIECYEDIKFDTQINNIVAQRNKLGKMLYGCKGENHLFQSWQVFSIATWLIEFKQIKPIARKKPGMGSFGS